MSNSSNTQFIQHGLSKTLGTDPSSTMSGFIDDYMSSNDEVRRHLAVTTALELIKSDIQSGDKKGAFYLKEHLDNLEEYADVIQQALKLK
ncbi:hypothetical protein [Vibrio diabolicus]|uniref:hypothetical protein n=1 Tax=Vibrio diabolicus TaxID=50719 RepID=UPI00215F83C5|nr:hypothetical protein [Vibrio diabolicus]MCS0400613.1 hypothetical protein [Vibrio diabolicus]